MIGQTLGSYRIVEQIGLGGMATVYKAYDPATDRYVAVKMLPEHYSNDPHFKKRFEREAKAIARLEHPHILPVHAFGEQDGITYLVMRYMPTGTLKDQMEVEKLSLEKASTILAQVADALDYAHEHGILHRDVKPSNILLDGKGNAYLTDFGIAKMVEASVELTGAGILGTPAYMSPEQCRGGKEIAPASDQYALGVVLYEMVTGRTPFQAETPLALVYMQLNDPLPPPRTLYSDVPEGVERAVLKALSKTPNERFPSCVALADAVARAVAAEVETRPSTPTAPESLTFDETAPPPALRPTRRVPVWIWPLAAILILAGLVGGAFALGLPGRLISSQRGAQAGIGTSPQVVATTPPGGTWIAPTRSPLTPTSTWSLPTSNVYDDFDNPAFDGSFDPRLWSPSEVDTMFQQDGMLVIQYTGSQAWQALRIEALKYSNRQLERPVFFEADLMLSPDVHRGSLSLLPEIYTPDSLPYHLEIHCGIRAETVSALAELFCFDRWNMGPNTFDDEYDLSGMYVDFGTWHTARIEIDPTTMTMTYYLDGQRVGSHTSIRAEQLKSAQFGLVIEMFKPTTEGVIGFVDNVRIGYFSP